MNCKTAKKMISTFMDGELPELKRRLLNEHINSCAGCHAELQALERIGSTLDMWPDITSTFNLADVKQRAALRQPSRIWDFLCMGQMPRWVTAVLVFLAILIGTFGGASLESIRQHASQQASSAAISDALSLGSSDDPLVNMVSASMPADPMIFIDGQEGN
ncbi:MAG: zf-HC2 domain-containing protein [Armatimonadota bacterium]